MWKTFFATVAEIKCEDKMLRTDLQRSANSRGTKREAKEKGSEFSWSRFRRRSSCYRPPGERSRSLQRTRYLDRRSQISTVSTQVNEFLCGTTSPWTALEVHTETFDLILKYDLFTNNPERAFEVNQYIIQIMNVTKFQNAPDVATRGPKKETQYVDVIKHYKKSYLWKMNLNLQTPKIAGSDWNRFTPFFRTGQPQFMIRLRSQI